ncbi:MAG TPA: NUDIX domain-containing protein [Candidatus Binatia bacterium]
MLDAIIAVITKGEKVLLIQRAPGIRGGGYWAPVSGEVEPGEAQDAAVAREAMEEVGLTVRPIRKVWENVSTRGTFRLHWWLADYVGGELALNAAEVSAARWLTIDQICRLDGTFEGEPGILSEYPSLSHFLIVLPPRSGSLTAWQISMFPEFRKHGNGSFHLGLAANIHATVHKRHSDENLLVTTMSPPRHPWRYRQPA